MIFNVAESTTGFPFDLTKVQIVVREREIFRAVKNMRRDCQYFSSVHYYLNAWNRLT